MNFLEFIDLGLRVRIFLSESGSGWNFMEGKCKVKKK